MLTIDANLIDLDEIHIWRISATEFEPADSFELFSSVLSEEEKQRRALFYFEKDRHQYLLTRHLIRSLLTYYYRGVAASEWTFATNEYGKPSIATPLVRPPLNFNITHSNDLIFCAVTLAGPIGIDVEQVREDRSLGDLSERFFAKKESDLINILDKPDRPRHFYRLWTLKEAFAKAEGNGLYIGLDQCSFNLESDTIRYAINELLTTNGRHHEFFQTSHFKGYEFSLAITDRGATPEPLRFRLFTILCDGTIEDSEFKFDRQSRRQASR